jgi:hypothetical protein
MRKAPLLVWCSSLAAADLGQLLEGHRFFELRRELSQLAAESQAVARRSHEEMAWAFERMGQYKKASEQWAEALGLTSKDDPATLQKVSLEPEAPPNSHDDGVLGMDALWGGFRIDFEAMRLELD